MTRGKRGAPAPHGAGREYMVRRNVRAETTRGLSVSSVCIFEHHSDDKIRVCSANGFLRQFSIIMSIRTS